MKNSHKFHRAWLVLVATMLIYAGSMGVMMNSMGVLFSAIIEDKGFRAGDLSLYYTIRSLCSSFAMPFTTKLFFKKNAKTVMGVMGTIASAGVVMMSLFNDLWQWYFAAVLVGVGTSCIMVVVPVVLNNWFHKRNGFAVGLTMSASGVAGAVFSPILAGFISALGWRQAAVVMGFVGFCLIVPPGLFLLVASPEKVGCRPYGEGEAEQVKGASGGRGGPRTQPGGYIFVLGLLVGIIASGIVQFNNQLPTFAKSVGYAGTVGALLTSCCMVGNLGGKLVFGLLNDRVGIYSACRLYLLVIGSALAGFLFLSGTQAALCVAALLFGSAYSLGAMSHSFLFLDLYGAESYRDKLSQMQAINGIASAFLSAAIPYMYDATGSFRIVFLCGLSLCCVAFLIYTYLNRYSRRQRAEG